MGKDDAKKEVLAVKLFIEFEGEHVSKRVLAHWWVWSVRQDDWVFHVIRKFMGKPKHEVYRIKGERLSFDYRRTCSDLTFHLPD